MLENLTIIRVGVLAKLQSRAKAWWMGWLVALVWFGVACYAMYQLTVLQDRIEVITESQRQTMLLQESSAQALINAWAEQKASAERLTEFADFVKERQSLVQFNADSKMNRRSALGLK